MRFLFLALIVLFSLNSNGQATKKKTETSTKKVQHEDNTVYNSSTVEVKPEYPEAGHESMYGFIRKNYVIPKDIGSHIGETVVISFIVEKDGNLSNFKVIRDLGYGTGEEAIRVFKLMPKWLPAENNGYHVRCSYSVPIRLYANE